MRWLDRMKDNEITIREFYDKLDVIHKDITEIKIQTTKTNGRVTKCESEIFDLKVHNCQQDKELKAMAKKYFIYYGALMIIIYLLTGYIIPFI